MENFKNKTAKVELNNVDTNHTQNKSNENQLANKSEGNRVPTEIFNQEYVNEKNLAKRQSKNFKNNLILVIGSSDSHKFNLFIQFLSEAKKNVSKVSTLSSSFDLKMHCEFDNIDAIIYVENWRPLSEDFEILRETFGLEELRSKFFYIFGLNNSPSTLEEARESFLEYDLIFDGLKIKSLREKVLFVKKQVWLLRILYFDDILNEINEMQPKGILSRYLKAKKFN